MTRTKAEILLERFPKYKVIEHTSWCTLEIAVKMPMPVEKMRALSADLDRERALGGHIVLRQLKWWEGWFGDRQWVVK